MKVIDLNYLRFSLKPAQHRVNNFLSSAILKLCIALFFAKQPALVAYSLGRTTALILDSGFAISQSCCVQNGFIPPGSVYSSSLAGSYLARSVSKHLKRNYTFFSCGDGFIESEFSQQDFIELTTCQEIFQNKLKVKYTVYGKEFAPEISRRDRSVEDKDLFYLPDGTEVRERDQRRLEKYVPEILFTAPKVAEDLESFSLPEILYKSTNSITNKDLKRSVLSNVICCGGISRYKNFSSRILDILRTERINADLGKSHELNVLTAGIEQLQEEGSLDIDTGNLTWTGGSILGSLPTFKDYAVSKELYEEKGSSVFDIKCP